MFTCPHDEMSSLKGHTLIVNWLNKSFSSKSAIIYLSNDLEQFWKVAITKMHTNLRKRKGLAPVFLVAGWPGCGIISGFL